MRHVLVIWCIFLAAVGVGIAVDARNWDSDSVARRRSYRSKNSHGEEEKRSSDVAEAWWATMDSAIRAYKTFGSTLTNYPKLRKPLLKLSTSLNYLPKPLADALILLFNPKSLTAYISKVLSANPITNQATPKPQSIHK
mmetsp:Transcript_15626/g.63786  ORF Transcript_15626/g.63786 Transcript_15626/m.63786 type:complete len:139 (-) Transcript_15626:1410-1826(-)